MNFQKLKNTRGFSLVEMAIVLLIAGLLIAGAFQLMNSMQQNRSDQATANEMRMVITAMERFINDQQGSLTASPLLNAPNERLLLNNAGLLIDGVQAQIFFRDNYLPAEFDLSRYQIGVRYIADIGGSGSGKPVLKALVLYTPANTLSEARRAKIAGLIGSQGGTVIDRGGASVVTGTQGAWRVDQPLQYGFASVNDRQLAAYTTTVDAQMNTNVLSRINTGNPEANTMRTDLLMGNASAGSGPHAIRNTAGYGMIVTDAEVGDACDSGSVSVTNNDTAQVGTLNLGDTAPNDTRNMIVMGTTTGGAQQTLVQCRSTGTVWRWESLSQLGSLYVYASENDRGKLLTTDTGFPGPYFSGGRLVVGDEPVACPGGIYQNQAKVPYQTLFAQDGNNKPTGAIFDINTFTTCRIVNQWHWNSGNTPIHLTVSLYGGWNMGVAILVHQNYDGTRADRLENAAFVSTDLSTGRPASTVIPPKALYAIAVVGAGNLNDRVQLWTEYR